MLDKLQLATFTYHHQHFIRQEENFHIDRFFLCRKHFKTFELETVKMPETCIMEFFLHQKMNLCRNTINIMKFKPWNFFIQHKIITEISIYKIRNRPRHIGTKKFLRKQITFREIIYQESFTRFKPAQYRIRFNDTAKYRFGFICFQLGPLKNPDGHGTHTAHIQQDKNK